MTLLPPLQVGEPLVAGPLSVFPLFSSPPSPIEYLLADEAIQRGAVEVAEVSEGGSVPELFVENRGDQRVLFVEGEELAGARQNRVLNSSILLAAHSKTKIPVSCVERGRWRYLSRSFGSSGFHCSPTLRGVLKKSVSAALSASGERRSDQGRVWAEVDKQQASLNVESPTAAMADTYTAHQEQLAAFSQPIEYVPGACGLAVAVGEKLVSVDFFDQPETCRKLWPRLVRSSSLDVLAAGRTADTPQRLSAAQVAQALDRLREAPWQAAPQVGEGCEYRTESSEGGHASALTFEQTTLHGSLVAAD